MIINYGQFGDVVSFDTTYKINKENRPFAVFVDLNHHQETIVFGATLMYDETTDLFIWLLQKLFLLIKMLQWQKLLQFGVFGGPGGVESVLSRFMDNIEEESQFVTEWNDMLDAYAWSAGMKSTQLNESFNASLKDYLKLVNLKISVKMLIQAREIYTKTIFEEFQEQFVEAVELNIIKCIEDGGYSLYTMTFTDMLSCNCRMFEIKGVLRSHIIKGFESENAYNLANEHASNLSRLVEDILCLEMNGNEHVKDQNSQDTNAFKLIIL
ncbi:hypothetical protein ACOSQ4_009683 [Xanthoceras sorbifolium]